LVSAAAMVWLTGCQTAGYKKSDAAALNSQSAARCVQTESQELEATIGALNELVNQPATNAEPQFLKFDQALDRLVASAGSAESEVNGIRSKGAAYFAVWDKEIPAIQDPVTRSVSKAREADVRSQSDATLRACDETRTNVQPLIVYLQDIRKALSTDLTRNGLFAIKSSVVSANDRASLAQSALAQSAAELDTLSARTASFRVQEVK
jgi:hypothetical protein